MALNRAGGRGKFGEFGHNANVDTMKNLISFRHPKHVRYQAAPRADHIYLSDLIESSRGKSSIVALPSYRQYRHYGTSTDRAGRGKFGNFFYQTFESELTHFSIIPKNLSAFIKKTSKVRED